MLNTAPEMIFTVRIGPISPLNPHEESIRADVTFAVRMALVHAELERFRPRSRKARAMQDRLPEDWCYSAPVILPAHF